jgi:hypothetical protein
VCFKVVIVWGFEGRCNGKYDDYIYSKLLLGLLQRGHYATLNK